MSPKATRVWYYCHPLLGLKPVTEGWTIEAWLPSEWDEYPERDTLLRNYWDLLAGLLLEKHGGCSVSAEIPWDDTSSLLKVDGWHALKNSGSGPLSHPLIAAIGEIQPTSLSIYDYAQELYESLNTWDDQRALLSTAEVERLSLTLPRAEL